MASARSPARPPIVAWRARAARARGARQVHRLHEGAGAPRVARPVQALGGPVRPAPAAVRVRGGAGASLRRVALPRRGAGAALRGVGCGGGGGVAGRRPSAEPRARMAGARGPTGARSGVGRSRPARPHGGRAGPRATPSSRRCRRRPTGRASRFCECRRRRAHAAPPTRRRGVGRVVSARTRRARLGTCVCVCVGVYAAVRACVCVRMRACAECIPAWASACACAC
jgi:hypothetical protein